MKKIMEGICALAVICALVEQLHRESRYFNVLRMIIGLQMLVLLGGSISEMI